MTLTADLDHIAILCKDVPTMLHFYTHTIQFAPCRVEQYMRGEAPFPSVRVNQTTIVDLFKCDNITTLTGLKNASHVCFTIQKSHFEDLKLRLQQAGIHVDQPVTRSGACGQGMSVYIKDPELNLLEFRWYEH